MAEWAIVDSSPLIFLSKADSLDFLRLAASKILVPESVAEEIRRRGPEDVTARAVAETAWLHVTPDPPIPSVIEHWDLGPGESAVLAHAREAMCRTETHRRLSPGLRGGILQALWPNQALRPRPWIAITSPSPFVRRG